MTVPSMTEIAVYGMGLTQHRLGVANVRMLMNLLLLRGNVGRLGVGICPVRGHSNVQGQRTVGVTEKPELAPLDRLKELYGFEPPRDKGWDTVHACEAVLHGRAKAFIGLGGNFVRAVPDTARIEDSWRALRYTSRRNSIGHIFCRAKSVGCCRASAGSRKIFRTARLKPCLLKTVPAAYTAHLATLRQPATH